MKRLKMDPIDGRRQSELETVPPTFRLDFVTAIPARADAAPPGPWISSGTYL